MTDLSQRIGLPYLGWHDHICDGCGETDTCLTIRPTLDGTDAYHLCMECLHNAARWEAVTRKAGD